MPKNSKVCRGITNTSKKDRAKKTNCRIKMKVCSIDEGTPSLTKNKKSVAGTASPAKKKKHTTEKHVSRKPVQSKKSLNIDSGVKTSESTNKRSYKRKDSLVFPNTTQKPKGPNNLLNFDPQPVTSHKKTPPSKTKLPKQKCADTCYGPEPLTVDSSTQPKTPSLTKETLLKKCFYRQKSRGGLKISDANLKKETLTSKRHNPKKDFVHSADGLGTLLNPLGESVTFLEKEILPKKTIRRKSKDFVLLGFGSVDNKAEISLSCYTTSKKSNKRRKSQDGLSLCGVGLMESQPMASKRPKPTENLRHSANVLGNQPVTFLATETLPKKPVRRKSKDAHFPRITFSHAQPKTSLEELSLLPRARRSSRLKSKEGIETSADSLFSQPMTLNKVVKRRKSKDFLSSKAGSSEMCPVTPLDKNKINLSPKMVQSTKVDQDSSGVDFNIQIMNETVKKYIVEEQEPFGTNASHQKSVYCPSASDVLPLTVGALEGGINNRIGGLGEGSITDHIDLVTIEDELLFDGPTLSPEFSHNYDNGCTKINGEIKEEQNDNLEGILQHIQNPSIELADNFKLLCANSDQNISVERMLTSPVPSEKDALSSDCNIVIESDLPKPSPIKECNIVLERLDSRYIIEYNRRINQEKNHNSSEDNGCANSPRTKINWLISSVSNQNPNKNLNNISQDQLSTMIKKSKSNSNKDMSVLNSVVTNQEIVSQFHKSSLSTNIERMGPFNSCLVNNDHIAVNKTLRPKLNKASILKVKRKLKCPKTKEKEYEYKNNHSLGLGRTVSYLDGSQHMVITTNVTKPQILTKPNDGEETKHIQQNFSSKSNQTYTNFNGEHKPLKAARSTPWNELSKDKAQKDEFESFSNCDAEQKSPSLGCSHYEEQESPMIKHYFHNASGSNSNKTSITSTCDFDAMNRGFKDKLHYGDALKLNTLKEVATGASLICEKHGKQDGDVKKQHLQNTQGHQTYETICDNIDLLKNKVYDTPHRAGVVRLKTLEDMKLQERSSTTEPRNLIISKETEKPSKVCTRNSQSVINNRSKLKEGTELPIYAIAPSSGFSFAHPTALPKQKVIETNYDDDDDISSEISFFVSKEIESAIDKVVSEPKHFKTTWNKFDRHSKYSDGEDDGCKDSAVINIKSYNIKEKLGVNTGMHVDENKFSEVSDSSWNRLDQKLTTKDGDQANKTISSRAHEENDVCYDLLAKDPLQDSPFNGYCIKYLRASLEDHACNLMHNVSCHLFSNVDLHDADRIDYAISEIIKENFTNPPEALVFAFVSFCVRFSKKTTLVRLGKCLKNNFNSNKEKADAIWYNFFKAIIDSKYFAMPNTHKCRFINITLQTIFGDIIDVEVFTVALKALEKLHFKYKSQVQLLMSVDFVFEKESRNRLNLNLIPLQFATSVIKQCLDSLNQSNQSSQNAAGPRGVAMFAYKVAKIFFNDFGYVKSLYSYNKYVVTSFVETTESRGIVPWLRNFYKVKQLTLSGLEEPSPENRKRSESMSPSRRHSTKSCSGFQTIECASDTHSLRVALERSFDIGELNPIEIYDLFKSSSKKEHFYNAVTLLRDPVKRKLSDVIMSLISFEADNNQWNICYRLYKNLYFDPKAVQNFDESKSPASNVLTLILVLLKNNKITDALNLFTKYNLCKDAVHWSLNYSPHDVVTSRHICSTFMGAFQSLDDETLYSVTMKLVPLQKSLAEPINLTVHVGFLINGLIERRQSSEAVKLITLIFDENKSKLLTLPSVYLYRTLVIILCNSKDLTHASMLFFKAEKRVLLYPTLPKSINNINLEREMCVELYSCLTKQEMQVAIFALLKLHGEVIKNIGFCVKFKVYDKHREEVIPCVFKPYISIKDDAIPNAIIRFKESVRGLIPNARFKECGYDSVGIEKVCLKEYMLIQNNSYPSYED